MHQVDDRWRYSVAAKELGKSGQRHTRGFEIARQSQHLT